MRWLIAVGGSLGLFAVLLAALAAIINYQQQQTNDIIDQETLPADQTWLAVTQSDSKPTTEQLMSQVLAIQLKQLSCSHAKECRLLGVGKSWGCQLAVNENGLALINELYQEQSDPQCLPSQYRASCLEQVCQRVLIK
jgi:hypothetical protein